MMHLSNNYEKKITPMQDFNFRYAKKINEKFAFKVKGGYLRADDGMQVIIETKGI